jgi:fructose/tagatose bisphosphate aldolase
MPLVTSKAMLEDAYRNRYAVAAFAIHNLEIMKAVVEAAEELESPVIFQTTPWTIRYVGWITWFRWRTWRRNTRRFRSHCTWTTVTAWRSLSNAYGPDIRL